ncbi:RING finger protein 207 [Aplysia californica]|uniref:RING finger protein 207 n=1 Tax=Aplysia californica TaxID=6500 RepID=A0ABM0JI93_APLCA|nr:RING finger protein 207 [Aplysia californica]
MSGEIFQPMESVEESSIAGTRNPLLCYLCNDPYEDPRILGCFHSFCALCLRGRASDGKMTCPLCGFAHTLKEGAVLPPSDLLLKFMVESTTEEKAQCANCDSTSLQMFFCNTCTQPLCGPCREETHRAKMFSSHDMVLLTKRAREVHKKCALHGEPYIMFSSEKKIMLCINCFRDMRIESRGHCLDLETAYKQSCKKLDLRVQAFRELQNSVREGVLLFRALLEEIKTNAEKEKTAIETLCTELLAKIEDTKAILLQKVCTEYTNKEATFHSQLKSLSALLPTLQLHLVISSAISGSANKFEFLDLTYVLMDRLKSIVQKQHPLHPTQSGQIDTSHKTEFFKSLEPLLYVPLQRNVLAPSVQTNSVTAVTTATSCPGSPLAHRVTPNHTRRANGLNGAKVKFIDAKGSFAEHCREFENAHRDLMQRFEQMKVQCQELQRDLTMRRCLANKEEVMGLSNNIELVQGQLDTHYSTLEGKLPMLEKHWEESLERINNEQDLFHAQLQDVMRLKHESQHLRVIASQLTSFVSSIAAVTERLAPKLGQTSQSSEQDMQMASLLEEINAVQPDSQQRVDAIRGAEEERQTILASRTNPLDDELIKTKGLLRAPSLRDKKGERRRREKEPAEKAEVSMDRERDGENGSPKTSSPPSTCESCAATEVEVKASGGQQGEVTLETASVEMPDICTESPPSKQCENGEVDAYVVLTLEKDSGVQSKTNDSVTEDKARISVVEDVEIPTVREEKRNRGTDKDAEIPTLREEKREKRNRGTDKDAEIPTLREEKREKRNRGTDKTQGGGGGCGDASLRTSTDVDSEVIRNLLKDIENVRKRDSLSSPKRLAQGGDCC